MKKVIVLLLCFLAFACGVLGFYLKGTRDKQPAVSTAPAQTFPAPVPETSAPAQTEEPIISKAYRVIAGGGASKGFDDYESAYAYAKDIPGATIWSDEDGRVIQENQKPFAVYYTSLEHEDFDTYAEAPAFAKTKSGSYIYYVDNSAVIWSAEEPLPIAYKIAGVPHIEQMPDYPRGCEITSLAMLMEYNGMPVSKAELAQNIKKDDTQPLRAGGSVYWGNPNDGFVGDMTDASKPGLGVYHGPVFELLRQYFPNSALDITGTDFDDLLEFVCRNHPVWVITNATFGVLSSDDFETWSTPSGKVEITYYEHSVLITGYDEQNIYFNDPLSPEGNSHAPREDFTAAWVQMGQQAVTVAN